MPNVVFIENFSLLIMPAFNLFWIIFLLTYNFNFSGFYLYWSVLCMSAIAFSIVSMILRIYYGLDGIIVVATNYFFGEPVQM